MWVRKVIVTKLLALTLAGSARGDQWTFFHPEEVKSIGYNVMLVDVQAVGEQHSHDQYVCEVHAERSPELGRFVFTAGYFPPTEKGRHQAEKVCSKWMDEASKKVKKAH